MKIGLISAFVFTVTILLSSCADAEDYLTTDIGQSEAQLPYFENFENGAISHVEVLHTALKWQIVGDGENKVLECTSMDESQAVAGKHVYDLAFGSEAWQDYSFSFDFKLSEESHVSFAPYIETNTDICQDSENTESSNSWVLQITSAGELYYDTMFDKGAHFIVQAPEVIEGFVHDGWNHVELISNGTELFVKLNGIDTGKVADLLEGQYGRIGLGGSVGCKIDNICADKLV